MVSVCWSWKARGDDMTVQNSNVKNIYIGNGSTTSFPFTFPCPKAEYIKVFVRKNNLIAQTDDFTVDLDNATVTYPKSGTPLAAGENLVILRELPLKQPLNLVNQGPFFAEDIETTLDEEVMMIQQLREQLGRSLTVPVDIDGETYFNTSIPIEAGKSFRVKDDGTGFEVTTDPGKVIDEANALHTQIKKDAGALLEQTKVEANKAVDAHTGAELALKNATDKAAEAAESLKLIQKHKALWYDNIAAMKADVSIKVGSYACTAGYYKANDGGGGSYIIRAKTVDDIEDGGSIHFLQKEFVAELIVENGEVNVKQFAAKGDEQADESDVLQTVLNYAAKRKCSVLIDKGAYNVSKELIVPRALNVKGINEQWLSKENQRPSFETGTRINLNGNGTLTLKSYVNLSNLTIYGTELETGLTMEDRCYVHDLTLMHLKVGISNNTQSSNLTRIERITITNSNTAISLQADNQKNSQSITFKDIDIRRCLYGLVSNQPANKFYNFCVQAGNTGGCSVRLLAGANNNSFYGSYFENADYTHEIICEQGAKYNQFLGGRIYTYASHLDDKDGSNVITCSSIQMQAFNYVSGALMFKKIGISGLGPNGDVDAPQWTMYGEGDENSIVYKINGTSSPKVLKYDKQIFLSADNQIAGNYLDYSMPYCSIMEQNMTIAANDSFSYTMGNFVGKNIVMAFANCISHHVICNVKINNTNGELQLFVYNPSSMPIDNQKLKFAVMTFYDVTKVV